MVYLILTRKGYSDLKTEFVESKKSFWVSSNILSESEARKHWGKNVNLTIFNKNIDSKNFCEIKEALYDIAEHDPGETIWLEKENAL